MSVNTSALTFDNSALTCGSYVFEGGPYSFSEPTNVGFIRIWVLLEDESLSRIYARCIPVQGRLSSS